MPTMPRSNIHLDILMGRDETLDVGDFFGGMMITSWEISTEFHFIFCVDIETSLPLDIHADMERKLRL